MTKCRPHALTFKGERGVEFQTPDLLIKTGLTV